MVSAGLLEGVVERAGLLMVMLSDLGQGFPTSYPGFEFIPETHCTQCLAVIFVDNLELPVDAGLAFAWRGLSAGQTRWFEFMKPTCCLAVLFEMREGVWGLSVLTDCFSTGKMGLVQTC